MSGVRRLEHAVLHVTDLETAVEFYTEVLGLVELTRRDDAVYLGCGLDDNYDLGLVEGGTGVDHVAVRVDSEREVKDYEARLRESGADVRRTNDEPNQEAGVRFTLPSGVDVEFVTVADEAYLHPTRSTAGRGGVAPLDLDHCNLMSHVVDEDVAFLAEYADFAVSDEIVDADGASVQSWLRWDEFHHDAGFTATDDPDETLHHLGFQMDSMEHIKRALDHLARNGYSLELGPSRHNAGSNLFAYFWAPGGNRVELSAEMATVSPGAETGVREVSKEANTVSSWGGGVAPTESFLNDGS